MKFADGCAGVGGFRIPLEKSGHECVWSCEVDTYARQVYRYHWKEPIAGDIRKVDTETIPDFDLFCAGFPCQAFSIAGKRKGFTDTRGTLFFEICRILRDKRPKMVLLENVKGLLSHDNYDTFKTILESLRELGYMGQYQVLNSKNFGVPQNRERVFIIGHLRDRSRPQVFPIGENDGVSEGENGTEQRSSQTQISGTLRGANTKADHTFIIHNVYGGFNEDKPRVFEDVAPTIRTPKGGGHLPMIVDTKKVGKPRIYGGCPTLQSNDYKEPLKISNGVSIRRLTPLECERLQGFPDNWTKYGITVKGEKIEISDTQRYKLMGNAVTVPVVEAIARKF